MLKGKNYHDERSLIQDLLARQKESGLTVRDFCANEGINPSSFITG